jgi:hypothetical protein
MPTKLVMNAQDGPDDFRKNRRVKNFRSISANEHFEVQHLLTEDLPDPKAFSLNVTHRALEVLAGTRDLRQISRWVTDDVYLSLTNRVNERLRKLSLLPAELRVRVKPTFTLSHLKLTAPRESVMEGSLMVRFPSRVRAVAFRIEGFDNRWRASSFTLL